MTHDKNYNIGNFKVYETTTFFNGDDSGSCSDLILFRFELNYQKLNYSRYSYDILIDRLREISEILEMTIDQMSFDSHTGCAWDCTGRPFGSSWKKIAYSRTDDCITVAFIHSYAYDI